MADLTITVADIELKGSSSDNHQLSVVTLGATLTAGTPVYQDASDSNECKACDASSSGTASCDGILLTGGVDGQKAVMLKKGPFDPGATVAVGTIYVVSANAGKIAPQADLSTNDYLSILGPASDAGTIDVDINNTGIQVA